jgi:predicted Zn-dependent protease
MNYRIFIRLIFGVSVVLLAYCKEKETPKIPKDVEKDLFQANQEFLDKKFDSALELTEKVMKSHSEYLPAAVLKGKILFYTKKHKEAVEVFSKILKAEPGHQGALLWLARIAVLDKKTQADAERYLLHGLNNHPEDFVLHYELAKLYNNAGNLRQAMVEYQKALMMEDELTSVYRNYEALLVQHKLSDRANRIKAKRIALEAIREK